MKKRRRLYKSEGGEHSEVVHSETDSNDYFDCLQIYYCKMTEDHRETAQWKNNSNLEITFATTLVEWKKGEQWDPKVRSATNWLHLANYVNRVCNVNLHYEQYKTKYYRWRLDWHLFKQLMGRVQNSITGVGFDWTTNQFHMSEEQWDGLIAENSRYNIFKGKSCSVYIILSDIFEGTTATGNQAQSSAQQCEPQQRRHQQRKGKGPTTSYANEDDVYIPDFATEADLQSQQNKRPTSSLGNSDDSGASRPSKKSRSSKSSGNTYNEVVSNLAKLSQMRIELLEQQLQRQTTQQEVTQPQMLGDHDSYGMKAAMKIVDSFRPTHPIRKACIKKLENLNTRIAFMDSEPDFQQYWVNSVLDD